MQLGAVDLNMVLEVLCGYCISSLNACPTPRAFVMECLEHPETTERGVQDTHHVVGAEGSIGCGEVNDCCMGAVHRTTLRPGKVVGSCNIGECCITVRQHAFVHHLMPRPPMSA